MKKTIYLLIIIFIILSCSDNKNNIDNNIIKIKVGYLSDFAGASAIAIAKGKGFFEEENLDAEIIKFDNGPSEILSMIGHEIEFGYIGNGAHSHAIKGYVKVLFPNGISKAEKIIAGKWTNIKTISDLKGKTVATHLGTSGETMLNIALKTAKLTKDDINLLNVNITNLANMIINKKADAVSIWEPHTKEIIDAIPNQYVVISSITNYSNEAVFISSFITTAEYINNNPYAAAKFSKAILKAMDYRKYNINDAVKITSEITGIDENMMKQEIDTAVWFSSSDLKNSCKYKNIEKWYNTQQKLFLDSGIIKENVPITNYLELDMLKNILLDL
ncbi:ABC transporter substrate-binding protein [Brachyspira innocens]|uniref:ABC transporter substrate-binding protein n=1 Tax=Brachyspira innocens TaxID=13264 RepID=A0ABT8YXZ4_9SPIR|nr:ABC transporter substrate-binding protein [Brachyspira innocens]MDO6994658.1 ABC transporter substrate-binding protein [Brachyspira innocens]MDO7020355.1 ABC transporter substrate-binding protein [Brachyspira innocens]